MTLTEQQIKNWRGVLAGMVGPYAFAMPVAEIKMIVENLQRRIDEAEEGRQGVTYHEDRASVTVAEDRARRAREASMVARDNRLASLSQRIADVLDE